MTYTTAFLDMDGVIASFIKSFLVVHNYPADTFVHEFELENVFNKTSQEIWGPINEVGIEFWANLDKTLWYDQVIDFTNEIADEIVLLTSPTKHHTCYAGKFLWSQKYCPDYPLVLTKQKYREAKSGTILIDDRVQNVERFIAHGGDALLFPRPWNTGLVDGTPESKIQNLRSQLSKFK